MAHGRLTDVSQRPYSSGLITPEHPNAAPNPFLSRVMPASIETWIGWCGALTHTYTCFCVTVSCCPALWGPQLQLWCVASEAAAHGPGCSAACRVLVPRPGIEPVSPASQSRSLTTGPPGKSFFVLTEILWMRNIIVVSGVQYSDPKLFTDYTQNVIDYI